MEHYGQTKCLCNKDSYSTACPQAYFQGDSWMHVGTQGKDPIVLERLIQAPPALMIRRSDQQHVAAQKTPCDVAPPLSQLPDFQPRHQREVRFDDHPDRLSHSSYNLSSISPEQKIAPRDFGALRSEDQIDYLEDQLRECMPMHVAGKTPAELTIGGFSYSQRDFSDVASEIGKLPPLHLPKIFCNTHLNFIHLFFRGLEQLAGADFIKKIGTAAKQSHTDTDKFLPVIVDLMKSGPFDEDDSPMLLVKRVFVLTFEIKYSDADNQVADRLFVRCNPFELQYLSGRMTCRDPDVRMWLYQEYSNYEMLWYNTLKGSGIPAFARGGVQDRYETTATVRHEEFREYVPAYQKDGYRRSESDYVGKSRSKPERQRHDERKSRRLLGM